MHLRVPKNRVICIILAVVMLAGLWAFFTLDMPARMSFHDQGMYWPYSGVMLFAANAAMMVLFAGLSALAAGRLKKRKETSR